MGLETTFITLSSIIIDWGWTGGGMDAPCHAASWGGWKIEGVVWIVTGDGRHVSILLRGWLASVIRVRGGDGNLKVSFRLLKGMDPTCHAVNHPQGDNYGT